MIYFVMGINMPKPQFDMRGEEFMNKHLSYLLLAVLVVATLVMAACQPAPTPEPTKPPEPTAAPTKAPEPTKPPEPTTLPAPELGTPENPLIMALAPSANTQELMAGGEAIAAKLTELTGYTIKTIVPTNYAALVEAMGSGNAHIGWLPTVPYIVAYEKSYGHCWSGNAAQ
jgi:phosphonate transport system substrate-binding protein